jgi:hypothetical protein
VAIRAACQWLCIFATSKRLLVAFRDKLVIFCAEVLSQHDAAAILVMFGTCGLPGELCGKD